MPLATGPTRGNCKRDATMQAEAGSRRWDGLAAHPLSELLDCPPETGRLLNGAARCIEFESAAVVFRQFAICLGLYVVVSGQFLRKTERLETRLTLGPARAGDLVELGAVLGDGRHTYTLSSLTSGSLLLLPTEALNLAFQNYSPLRMQLLAELAREISRGYFASCKDRPTRTHRRGSEAAV
jgi:CRP-like cAMP-binding protein